MYRFLMAAAVSAFALLPLGAQALPSIAVYGGTDGISGTSHIANELSATGAFSSVTILTGSESEAALSSYSSILFYTNVGGDLNFANKMTDYVATGGHLVAATFLEQANAMGGANGLGTLAPLLPFTGYNGNYITQVSLGTTTAGDPLLSGVGSLSAFYHDNTTLSPGARLVASWSDGTPLVATTSSGVVGVNLFPNDAYGYVYGDYVRLFTNALGGTWQNAGAVTQGNADGPVPEPASLALFGSGLCALGVLRRRRR